MANEVEIQVTLKDEASAALKAIPGTASAAGSAAGRGFAAGIAQGMAQAGAAIDDVDHKLDDLGSKNVTPRVDLDSGDATAELDELDAKLDEVGHKHETATVDVNDDEAKAALSDLGSRLGGLAKGLVIPLALGGLAASIPALGGILGAVTGAAGVGALAFSGLGKAVSDSSKATQQAGQSSASLASTELSNAIAIKSAQQSISDAKTQAAHDIITSDQQIQSAEESLKDAQNQASQDAINSAQQVASAEEGLKNAQQQEQQAQQSLTQARAQAILTLQQLNDAQVDGALSSKQAALDLQQAQLNQQQTDSSFTATTLQKQQAALATAEAQQALVEAQQNATNTTQAANTANKEGVNQMPAVVSAQQAYQQSIQGVSDAQTALANAHRQATQTQVKDNEAIGNAQTQLAQAQQQAAWTQQKDAEAVATAEQNLSNTYAQQQAAAKDAQQASGNAATAFQKDMAGMTLAGQHVVNQLITLKGKLNDLKADAQNAVLPGFSTFLTGITSLMPLASTEVTKFGGLLGSAFSAIGKALGSSSVQSDLKTVFDEGYKLLQVVGPALGGLAEVLLKAGAAAAPLTAGLGAGLAGLIKGLGDFVTDVMPAAPAMGQVFSAFGKFFEAVGGPLGSLVATVLKDISPDIVAITQAFSSPGVIGGISGVVTWLANLITDVPPKTVGQIALGLVAVSLAIKGIKFGAGVIDDTKTFVKTLQGLPFLGKLFGGGTTTLTTDTNMTTAADTMYSASLNMLKAAGAVSGENIEGAAGGGAAGAAGKVAGSGILGTGISLSELIPVIALTAGAAFGLSKVKLPGGGNLLSPKSSDLGIHGSLAAPIFGNGKTTTGPLPQDWDAAYQSFMNGFGSPIAKFFTQTFPDFFTKSIPGVTTDLYDDGVRLVSGLWDGIKKSWSDVTGWFGKVPGWISSVFNGSVNWLDQHGKDTINGLWIGLKSTWSSVSGWFAKIPGWISGAFNGSVNWLNQHGKDTINGLWNGLKNIWNSVSSWFGKVPGWISGAFKNAGQWLWNDGYYVVEGLWNGMKNIWKNVTSWVSGIAGWIKAHKGPISLDQNLLKPAGEAIMGGFFSSLKNKYKDVKGFVSGVAGDIASFFTGSSTSGVGQWKSDVDKALKMLGLSTSLDANVLYQMQTESGGNPNAINNWDSNAAAGDPSRGLMQVIGTTFAEYRSPSLSNNIYDPMANIYAAINYARHVYGPNLANQYGGIGSGHGYAAGGATSAGWATVGERGRELVKLPGGATIYPSGASTAGGMGGSLELHITADSDSNGLMNELLKSLRYEIRKRGGNVQSTLGVGH